MIARISYTDFDGENFMSKIDINTNINDKLVSQLAPKVVEGVKRLKDWVENN